MTHTMQCTGHDLLVPDVVRAEGCWVEDDQGRRYADLSSGVWCLPLGHRHPAVQAAMLAQAERIVHSGFGYASAATERAAAALCELTGLTDGQCLFLTSGSEAVELGLQAARLVAGSPRFLRLADAFCGSYGSVFEERDDHWFRFDGQACAPCRRPGCAGCPRWESIPFAELGGFLFEPGSASGQVRFPPERLIQALAERIRAAGGLILVNEVTTGMGRTGRWFGFQHYGLRPDFVAVAKGLGNGYPVSAGAFHGAFAARLGRAGFHYSQSHQNDPLGAAVAEAVIRTLRDGDWIERGRLLGEFLLEQFQRLAAIPGSPILAVRGRGPMLAVELDPGRVPAERAREIRDRLFAQGFLVCLRPQKVLFRLDPPLILPRKLAGQFVAAFGQALETAGSREPDSPADASQRSERRH
jgi:acetylornithine aminotransferase